MLKAIKKEDGQAMAEFALVFPILILVVCGIIDFGWMFFNQLTLQNATNVAARSGVVSYDYNGGDKTKLTKQISQTVENNLINGMDDNLNVDVNFSNPGEPLNGNLELNVTTEIKFLTPFMGSILRKNTWELSASTVMRMES